MSSWDCQTPTYLRWPARLDDLVLLGTPHHGAPLELVGSWDDMVLGSMSNAAPFVRLGKVLSAGVTDLRHSSHIDEDWGRRDRFARGPDHRQRVPLPDSVRCFVAAASIGQQRGDLKDRLQGDGHVPLYSALFQHPDPTRALVFAEGRQWIGKRMSHIELLSHAEVYAQLRQWLGWTRSSRL